jgi:hypothetical protein
LAFARTPPLRRIVLLFVSVVGVSVGTRPADAAQSPQPDPAATRSTETYPDTTLLVQESAPDTSSAAKRRAAEARAPEPPSVIDFEEQRKRGDVSLEQAFRGRRGGLLLPLPLFGSVTGALSVPDAGSRIRSTPLGTLADVATDPTLFSAAPYGIGIFDLGVTLVDPRADAVETLDLTSLRNDLTPGPFLDAGELLTRPAAERAFPRVMQGEGRRLRRARSGLYYGHGEGGILDTGARFVSPEIGNGVGGSYARHEADGVFPLRRAISSRYAVAAGLPRALGHSFWVEGSLFEWDVEDEAYGVDPQTGDVTKAPARAEVSSRDLTLHARRGGERWASSWTLRAGDAKRTRVDVDGGRERWEFPALDAAWNASLAHSPHWTSLATVEASTRRISYRVDQNPLFEPRRETARAGVGLRRSLASAGGVGVDLTADWRETESTVLNGRASLWGDGGRARGRLDVEWAHERPSWVDLLSPPRTIVAPHLADATQWLRLARSGDPTLQPRVLAGGLARGSIEISRGIVLEAEGSVRRLHDDFGWNLTVDRIVDTLVVETRARNRGDGWRSYGALGVHVRPGPLKLRGVGWVRGGPDGLSPQASSPPHYGAEVSVDIRVTLFQGDLPLEVGYDLHAVGPREGLFDEPGSATSDLSVRADFGPAGAFAKFDNLLNRRVPSAIYDVAAAQPVSMTERLFRFGIVWYLLD